jgi:16S rRNA (guanine(527)-N(7))-methyltransferase RsmG
MRKKPTEAEAMLWKQLNNDQLGVRFRRQHPIDGKILDFYCHDARLGIELDGATHTQQEQKEWDDERTQSLLASHGIRVMRFWNGDVLHNLDSVLEKIRKAIHHSPPSPALPPQGEGGTEGLGLPAGRQGWEEIKFLDIGTGGGFPLLPLALCLPDCSFTGIDSTQKKIDAVYRIVERLGLENCRLFCGRTEELGREAEHREQYDVVTARAVAPVNILLEYAAPFTKVGGHVVLWKSLNIEKELEESLLARAELSCHLVKQHEYSLEDCLPAEASSEDGLPAEAEGHVVSDDVGPPSPRLRRATFCEGWGERQLLVFEKTFATKEIYPRDTGIPKKNPLR